MSLLLFSFSLSLFSAHNLARHSVAKITTVRDDFTVSKKEGKIEKKDNVKVKIRLSLVSPLWSYMSHARLCLEVDAGGFPSVIQNT